MRSFESPAIPGIRRIAVGFGLALSLLIGAGVLAYINILQATNSARWVDHTREVIERIDALLVCLGDVKDGQHGVLVTAAVKYAKTSQEAMAGLKKNAEEIRRLTADNLSQQRRLDQVELLIKKLAQLETAIDVALTSELPRERRAILDQESKQSAEIVQQLGRQMRAEEYRLLRQRTDQVVVGATRTRIILLIAMGTAVVLVALAITSLYREKELGILTRHALEESEMRHQLAVEASGIGTWSWDPTNRELLWSEQCKEMFGLPHYSATSYDLFDKAIHPDDRGRTQAAIKESLERSADFDTAYRAMWPDGTFHWLRSKGRPQKDAAGKVVRFQGIVIDIDEQKLAEQALQRSERRYSALFANKTNAIAHCRPIYDADGTPIDFSIVQVNHAYEQITGIRKADVEGKTVREVFPGIEFSSFDFIGNYGRIAQNGGELSFEVFFEWLKQWLTVYAYSPEQGEVIAIFTDSTRQKNAEEALRTSERRFRQLAEHIQEVFWVMELQTKRMLYVSPAYEAVWGRSSEALYADAEAWIDAVQEDDCERVRKAFAAAMETCVFDETFAVRRPDGSRAWIWNRGWPVRNEEGRIYRMVGVAEDFTKRHEAEREVHRLNAELEHRVQERTAELQAANQELEAFSYSVSHDLRAPLRGIDGFARILVEEYAPQLEAKPQRYLELIRTSAKQMGNMVDDLLRFSRLKKQDLKRQQVNVEKLVQEVWAELQPDIEARKVELVLAELPSCAAEPAMLRQVWFNLLANAVKFTRKREHAQVEVGWLPGSNGTFADTYFVRDNGVGFDMRYAGEMFSVFQRLHRAEDYEGTGVGLAIVQRIVRRHGGDVAAEAAPNQGATFYFTLEGRLPQQSKGASQNG